MADTTCGYCGRLAHMKAASGLHVISPGHDDGETYQAVYKCPQCERLNLATQSNWQYGSASAVLGGDASEQMIWSEATWLPHYGDVIEFEDVPEHIALAASEATLCLSVGAYRAVGSLARAVIEATAKDKKAEGRTLQLRIDALRNGDHIRKHTQEQAHEVRHFGNDMAHGDFVQPITKEEAEEVVELMVEVLDEVYQSPARLLRLKAARLAKKAEAEEG